MGFRRCRSDIRARVSDPMPSPRPILAITLGDPGGIGPEIVAKALADPAVRQAARCVVLGPVSCLREAADAAGLDLPPVALASGQEGWPDADVLVLDAPLVERPVHRPTASGGALSRRLVEDAIGLARRPLGDPRRVDGVVTAPISKKAWNLAGFADVPGHTELFAQRFDAARTAMMFVSPTLRVVLATAHLPLMRVASSLTTERIVDAIVLGAAACRRLGIERPRVAVCGLNPHAGEDGLLGDEDSRHIAPAISRAREMAIDAHGPLPGDTVWNAAAAPPLGRGRFDLVVAMYHDQGLIPVKLIAWDCAVNVTIGLPTVRTSPDHGTAFDIAGQNKADPGSMIASILLAARLAATPAT